MPKLALLDDRGPQRETIAHLITTQLPGEWTCINAPLLSNPADYPRWLLTNDVHVLLADHKLDEHAEEEGSVAVDYTAPDVIAAIRKTIPSFPIFILTAYPHDAYLLQHVADAEAVIQRRTFAEEITTHVPRMLRSANRFAEEHQKQLAELGTLASAAASGKAGPQDLERMKALQASIGLSIDSASSADRKTLLAEMEGKLDKMEEIQRDIEAFLKQRGERR
jgi:hypothetical protein